MTLPKVIAAALLDPCHMRLAMYLLGGGLFVNLHTGDTPAALPVGVNNIRSSKANACAGLVRGALSGRSTCVAAWSCHPVDLGLPLIQSQQQVHDCQSVCSSLHTVLSTD